MGQYGTQNTPVCDFSIPKTIVFGHTSHEVACGHFLARMRKGQSFNLAAQMLMASSA
jgi:hypothetical protein